MDYPSTPIGFAPDPLTSYRRRKTHTDPAVLPRLFRDVDERYSRFGSLGIGKSNYRQISRDIYMIHNPRLGS